MSLSSPLELTRDLLRFFVLASLSAGLGLGLIRLFRVPLGTREGLFAAPAVALSFWAVFLGFGVALGEPVRLLAGPAWAISGAMAFYGLLEYGPRLSRWDLAGFAGIIALATVVVAPYFLFGLVRFPGSPLPDGWSYVAFGQYLWTYPNGTDGGLAPLFQYAAHVTHTRRVAAALLGLFSVIMRAGETQSSAGLFLAWMVFVFASSCTFFALSTALLTRAQLLAYAVFTTASGWIANLLWANNFDNGLALSLAPAFAGLLANFEPRLWGWHLLFGLCAAGLLHVYPELAPLVAVLCVLVVAARWRWERTGTGKWLLAGATSAGLALVLTWPFVPDMVWFVRNQASVGLQSSARPGESMFPGLLALRFQPSAFWALGGEYATSSWLAIGNLTGVMMTVLAGYGSFALLRTRHAGATAWLVLIVLGAISMIVVSRYSYGAYKLILLGWWALAFAVIVGTSVVRRLGPRAPVLVCLILAAVAAAQTAARERKSVRIAGPWDLAAYGSVRTLANLSLSKAILIAVDDPIASPWAVYFLRDAPAALGRYRSYLSFAHVRPYLDRARHIRPEAIGYVLTDQAPERVVDDPRAWQTAWSSGPYRLMAPTRPRWTILADISNPYGLETVEGKPFFWMGPEPTVVNVLSGSAGVLTLHATFHPGPSAPSSPQRRVRVKTDSGYQNETLLAAGESTLAVPTVAGADRIVMSVLDRATAPAPNGDARDLLLGVADLRIGLGREEIVVRHVSNANGLERLDDRPFFWMGAGDTIVTFDTGRDGTAQLSADFTPGPSGPSRGERRLEIIPPGAKPRLVTVGPGRNAFTFPVQAGENRLVLRALDAVAVPITGDGDRRPLIVGLKGLRIDPVEQPDDRVPEPAVRAGPNRERPQ